VKRRRKHKVEVDTFNQIIPAESGYLSTTNDAMGKITIPDHAQLLWNLSSGPFWSWNQETHFREDSCPVCKASKHCTQNVTVWSRSRTVLVVHDYKPVNPC